MSVFSQQQQPQQQTGMQGSLSADGYGFSNTSYDHMHLLDTQSAVAAFKQAFSRYIDR